MRLSAILACGAALATLSCFQEPTSDDRVATALSSRPPKQTYKSLLPTGGNHMFLAVLAGQGAGPIRVGANVAQVERLMQAPCEVRSENLCRYVTRGMDFNLLGGITQSLYIQRAGRPAGKSATGEELRFGFFQGMIPPDLRLGMLPEAIQQHLGPPQRVEKVPGPNPQNTIERHYYPGMVLDYDWWPETERLILGGIRIVRDPSAVPVSAAPDAGAPADVDAGAPRTAASVKAPAGDAGAPRREPEPR